MKPIKLATLFAIAALNAGCQNQSKQNTQKDTPVIKKEKEYQMNIDLIKQHIEWQTHIESTEDGSPATYNYTEKDVEIALPIISQGLRDKGFKELSDSAFNNALSIVFGGIRDPKEHTIRCHNKFNTIIAKEDEKEDEYDYTVDNIFVSKDFKFISWVPLLGDFIELTNNNSYKIDLHPRLIARNKYLFNNSQPDLAYLLAEDSLFLKTLLRSFGYTREPKINSLVMNDYLNLDDNHMPAVGEIIFVKNGAGELEIKQELLQWITDHTTVNDNALALALAQYAYSLYSNDDNEMYTNNPFKIFTLEEKRKIAAYIANTYEPLYYSMTPKNSRIWPNSTVLENLLVEDEGLAAYLKAHKYFLLPRLKQQLEPAD